MKTIHSNHYAYVGDVSCWHVFKCIKKDCSAELLFEETARYVREDGSSQFFDPIIIEREDIDPNERMERLLAYSMKISSNSASVKPRRKVGRIPKRNGG